MRALIPLIAAGCLTIGGLALAQDDHSQHVTPPPPAGKDQPKDGASPAHPPEHCQAMMQAKMKGGMKAKMKAKARAKDAAPAKMAMDCPMMQGKMAQAKPEPAPATPK